MFDAKPVTATVMHLFLWDHDIFKSSGTHEQKCFVIFVNFELCSLVLEREESGPVFIKYLRIRIHFEGNIIDAWIMFSG